MPNDEPQLQLTTYDTAGRQLDKLTTAMSAVPDGLGVDDAALIALLDAVKRYHHRHPALATIEIEVVSRGGSSVTAS